MTGEARARILAATSPAARHLTPAAREAVEWIAGQDEAIVDGVVELLGTARALAPEPTRTSPPRGPHALPHPRRLPTDTAGNSGP